MFMFYQVKLVCVTVIFTKLIILILSVIMNDVMLSVTMLLQW
jgi:hypothetical protein